MKLGQLSLSLSLSGGLRGSSLSSARAAPPLLSPISPVTISISNHMSSNQRYTFPIPYYSTIHTYTQHAESVLCTQLGYMRRTTTMSRRCNATNMDSGCLGIFLLDNRVIRTMESMSECYPISDIFPLLTPAHSMLHNWVI